MGCDIHGTFQIRQRWDNDEWKWLPTSWPRDRNYRLFAVLANVRNGTWGSLPFISEPRGKPEGLKFDGDDDETIVMEKAWWVDGVSGYRVPGDFKDVVTANLGDHSHSWLTLDEMLAFDWEQSFTSEGMVRPDAPRDEKGRPTTYSAWTSDATATKETWQESIAENCRDFLLTIRYLRERFPKDGHGAAEIRFVFGFDS